MKKEMSSSDNSNKEKREMIRLKILILGDSAIGKTSLLLKYVDGYFPKIYISTLGVEFKSKTINLNGMDIKLQIWDTAGQERFHCITKNFMKGSDGIIFAYDITNRSTFDNLKNWISEAQEAVGDFEKIIVGNKIDLEKERKVSKESLNKFCENKKIKGMEISVKKEINVNECFEALTKLIIEGKSKEELLQKYGEVEKSSGNTSLNNKLSSKNKKNCC